MSASSNPFSLVTLCCNVVTLGYVVTSLRAAPEVTRTVPHKMLQLTVCVVPAGTATTHSELHKILSVLPCWTDLGLPHMVSYGILCRGRFNVKTCLDMERKKIFRYLHSRHRHLISPDARQKYKKYFLNMYTFVSNNT